MKVQLSLLILALVLVMTSVGTAQPPHPTDPGAVYIGSFTVSVAIGGSTSSSTTVTGKKGTSGSGDADKGKGCAAISAIFIYRTSTGTTDYVVDPVSIKMSAGCAAVDGVTTQSLFDLISKAAVIQGMKLGYSPCMPGCTNPPVTKVYAATCVQRSGTGSNTRFVSCAEKVSCSRRYTICCPYGTGTPVVTTLPAETTGCISGPPGCESTCPSGAKDPYAPSSTDGSVE